MIREESDLMVADNTGAKRVCCFRVLGQRKKYAYVGDIIKVAVQEAQPSSTIKKGQVCDALIVRTKHPLRRDDGSYLRFDNNAVVMIACRLMAQRSLEAVGSRKPWQDRRQHPEVL